MQSRGRDTQGGGRDGGWICFGWIWDYGIFYAMGIIKTSIVNSPLPLWASRASNISVRNASLTLPEMDERPGLGGALHKMREAE